MPHSASAAEGLGCSCLGRWLGTAWTTCNWLKWNPHQLHLHSFSVPATHLPPSPATDAHRTCRAASRRVGGCPASSSAAVVTALAAMLHTRCAPLTTATAAAAAAGCSRCGLSMMAAHVSGLRRIITAVASAWTGRCSRAGSGRAMPSRASGSARLLRHSREAAPAAERRQPAHEQAALTNADMH